MANELKSEVMESTEEQKGVVKFFLPEMIGKSPSVKPITYEKDGRQMEMTVITLPGGTRVVDVNGNEHDVSFHTALVQQKYAKLTGEGKSNYVRLPSAAGDKPYTIQLRKEEKGEVDGEWQTTATHEVVVTSEALAEAVEAQHENRTEYVTICVPKQLPGREEPNAKPLVAGPEAKEPGIAWREITLPPHSTFKGVEGEDIDGAYLSFTVKDWQVSPAKNENYLAVKFLKNGNDGEYIVILSKYEGKDEAGLAVYTKYPVAVTELKAGMDNFIGERAAYAAAQSAPTEKQEITAPLADQVVEFHTPEPVSQVAPSVLEDTSLETPTPAMDSPKNELSKSVSM